jgi:hypothetical protein
MSLKDYLKETLDLGRDDVFKVDVKEGFSFNTDPEHTDKVMEVLNNVQGRRINVEISKMMVAEDVITTEEVLVVVVLVAEEVLLQEEKAVLHQEEKVQAVVEGQKLRSQRRWIWWKKLSKRRRFWRKKFSSRGEGSSDRAQDVPVTHLDQEDQEETNIYC